MQRTCKEPRKREDRSPRQEIKREGKVTVLSFLQNF